VKNINFARLHRAIATGLPDSLAVTATSLTSGESVAFVETSRPVHALGARLAPRQSQQRSTSIT
jgi:hypothetical protein